jgi:hypothetical protein
VVVVSVLSVVVPVSVLGTGSVFLRLGVVTTSGLLELLSLPPLAITAITTIRNTAATTAATRRRRR